MATNTGRNFRRGAIRSRSQIFNPNNARWIKRNAVTGRFTNVKADPKPFKGVRKEDR